MNFDESLNSSFPNRGFQKWPKSSWFLSGNITRKLDKAPKKDTVIIPDGGFTIIRFLTDNPGWWFFHCHLEFHVEVNMPVFDESKPPG